MQGRYTPDVQDELPDLLRWRCDMRRFHSGPVQVAVSGRCLTACALAPSVGLSQPWRPVRADGPAARRQVAQDFTGAGTADCSGDRAQVFTGGQPRACDEMPELQPAGREQRAETLWMEVR